MVWVKPRSSNDYAKNTRQSLVKPLYLEFLRLSAIDNNKFLAENGFYLIVLLDTVHTLSVKDAGVTGRQGSSAEGGNHERDRHKNRRGGEYARRMRLALLPILYW